ncbi:MAG: hypothetical protein VX642_09110 [Bdellovibrionota bacterium]|nr:hypothetical protein [Bdellovibrionota bacterium]
MEQIIYNHKPTILGLAGASSFVFVGGPMAFFSGSILMISAYAIHSMRANNAKRITKKIRPKNFIA